MEKTILIFITIVLLGCTDMLETKEDSSLDTELMYQVWSNGYINGTNAVLYYNLYGEDLDKKYTKDSIEFFKMINQ